MDSITIKLAGKDYKIQSLTIQQLEDLHVGLFDDPQASKDPREEAKAVWDRNVNIIAIALSEDHPDMTQDAVRKLRIGKVKAAGEIVTQILEFTGLSSSQEKPSGEAAAGSP